MGEKFVCQFEVLETVASPLKFVIVYLVFRSHCSVNLYILISSTTLQNIICSKDAALNPKNGIGVETYHDFELLELVTALKEGPKAVLGQNTDFWTVTG